jgi:hypothetical protein
VSVLLATQRLDALLDTTISQADLLVAPLLTRRADIETVTGTRGSYVAGSIGEPLSVEVGAAFMFGSVTERARGCRSQNVRHDTADRDVA